MRLAGEALRAMRPRRASARAVLGAGGAGSAARRDGGRHRGHGVRDGLRPLRAEGIAFDCLRVVSDDLARPLPAELSAILDGERLSAGRLCSACLARRPSPGRATCCGWRGTAATAGRVAGGGLMEMARGPGDRSVTRLEATAVASGRTQRTTEQLRPAAWPRRGPRPPACTSRRSRPGRRPPRRRSRSTRSAG